MTAETRSAPAPGAPRSQLQRRPAAGRALSPRGPRRENRPRGEEIEVFFQQRKPATEQHVHIGLCRLHLLEAGERGLGMEVKNSDEGAQCLCQAGKACLRAS